MHKFEVGQIIVGQEDWLQAKVLDVCPLTGIVTAQLIAVPLGSQPGVGYVFTLPREHVWTVYGVACADDYAACRQYATANGYRWVDP